MKVAPKSSLRPFLHQALQILLALSMPNMLFGSENKANDHAKQFFLSKMKDAILTTCLQVTTLTV